MAGMNQSTAERMAIIREAAKKFQTKQTKMARFERMEKEDSHKDERYWTDAPRYADQHYGETFRATVRFDNDWE
jgi:hypothetical protein